MIFGSCLHITQITRRLYNITHNFLQHLNVSTEYRTQTKQKITASRLKTKTKNKKNRAFLA